MAETSHERTPVPPGGGAAERLREFRAARGDVTPEDAGPAGDDTDRSPREHDGAPDDTPDDAPADESPDAPRA